MQGHPQQMEIASTEDASRSAGLRSSIAVIAPILEMYGFHFPGEKLALRPEALDTPTAELFRPGQHDPALRDFLGQNGHG